MKKINSKLLAFATLILCAAILHLTFIISSSFSDYFNNTVSHYFRLILAKLSDIFPFSIAEILLFLIPIFIISLIIYVNKKDGSISSKILLAVNILLAITSIIYVLFVFTFAPGYNCSELDERLSIDKKEISATELYETLSFVTQKVNEASEKIVFNDDGSSSLPYSYNQLSSLICHSYTGVFDHYNLGESYNSRIKTLNISPVMTYTHISGVYSFFTGEANLNTNYPDYVCAFSTAHEFAHQRGIAREDEANFTAYLVCIESDDEYLQYAGYLSMFSYLSTALRTADYELYIKAVSPLCDKARGELTAYSNFFDKYRDNTVSTISDAVNDTYLKIQGTAGVKSYGMVVDLAVAYHRNDS